MHRITNVCISHRETQGKKFYVKLSKIHEENRKLMIFQSQKNTKTSSKKTVLTNEPTKKEINYIGRKTKTPSIHTASQTKNPSQIHCKRDQIEKSENFKISKLDLAADGFFKNQTNKILNFFNYSNNYNINDNDNIKEYLFNVLTSKELPSRRYGITDEEYDQECRVHFIINNINSDRAYQAFEKYYTRDPPTSLLGEMVEILTLKKVIDEEITKLNNNLNNTETFFFKEDIQNINDNIPDIDPSTSLLEEMVELLKLTKVIDEEITKLDNIPETCLASNVNTETNFNNNNNNNNNNEKTITDNDITPPLTHAIHIPLKAINVNIKIDSNINTNNTNDTTIDSSNEESNNNDKLDNKSQVNIIINNSNIDKNNNYINNNINNNSKNKNNNNKQSRKQSKNSIAIIILLLLITTQYTPLNDLHVKNVNVYNTCLQAHNTPLEQVYILYEYLITPLSIIQ